ncbi:protein MEMO1-like [Paramacrobiotus metropolitanus]|uniref:protein MEMO1-like n=1 Tax=Paramacrobiotus metropolitanus TaxID=2943436 RepID=UPI0024458BBD|nr:protein MEMO1-like [Paramacrobiotus metropolitanus]XP_055338248.1 protein MEMO1-like [Paramacrobiotus metropolitanus]
MAVRKATHAGSWYLSDGAKLDRQLSGWLKAADESEPRRASARAIIAPHAGYAYSGPCAAFAYNQIDPSTVKRIFVLGPSHHVYLDGCALTTMKQYETPLYNLPIDQATVSDLRATKMFQDMSQQTDEEEHSLEMHLPYIAKIMESRKGSFSIVPVLVGNLSAAKEAEYGSLLSKYLDDPTNLFVVSSDFCHWGKRFNYIYYNAAWGEIHESIEKLDRLGMDIIEELNAKKFRAYLQEYGNTVCGRNPISILLAMSESLRDRPNIPKMALKFTKYAQSNPCKSTRDSSVSYASASLVLY